MEGAFDANAASELQIKKRDTHKGSQKKVTEGKPAPKLRGECSIQNSVYEAEKVGKGRSKRSEKGDQRLGAEKLDLNTKLNTM